ncbi:MAG: alpha/beta hydrolase [Lentilitoribacter sp.]
MNLKNCLRMISSMLIGSLLVACSSSTKDLSPIPNLFAGGYPDKDVSHQQRTATPQIFYVTDRSPFSDKNGNLGYGHERSPEMIFGVSQVSFGNNLSWPELINRQKSSGKSAEIGLNIVNNKEIVKFEPTPLSFEVRNGKPTVIPAVLRSYKSKRQEFQSKIAAELERTNKKEILVFVHGFNNTFDDSIFTVANLWHASGRVGLPIAYSWPAGVGGLSGYLADRESGEFSVFHLKEFLRHLSAIPSLEKIHIVAHSRGTDVTTTALRELVIASRSAGKSPRQELKISNLILAAPDLNFGVVSQRLIAERFGPAMEQITVYINQADSALGIAQRLTIGQRFGKLTVEDLTPTQKKIFSKIRNVNFVDVEGAKGASSHAYFRTNPGVLSDIAILVREGAFPGAPKRPLENIDINFWKLPDGYPN